MIRAGVIGALLGLALQGAPVLTVNGRGLSNRAGVALATQAVAAPDFSYCGAARPQERLSATGHFAWAGQNGFAEGASSPNGPAVDGLPCLDQSGGLIQCSAADGGTVWAGPGQGTQDIAFVTGAVAAGDLYSLWCRSSAGRGAQDIWNEQYPTGAGTRHCICDETSWRYCEAVASNSPAYWMVGYATGAGSTGGWDGGSFILTDPQLRHWDGGATTPCTN